MIRLTWIGHATVVIDIDGVRLLTDPLLRRHAGPLRRIGGKPDPDAWRDPDAVLISHLHSDHAGLGSLRKVTAAPMLTGPRNVPWLERRADATAPVLGEDEWVRVLPAQAGLEPAAPDGSGAGVRVRLVRADHSARPLPHRPNDTHGHLIRGDGTAIWFAGDTSLYPEMAGLPDLAGGRLDVALLPIAGWGPKLSPGHMGPHQAAEACVLVKPAAVLPIHHGTLHPRGFEVRTLEWMHRPLEEFKRELADLCPDVKLLDLGLGESTEID